MPRATCRCGHELAVPSDATGKVVCANCGAKVRIRRRGDASGPATGDGYIRFYCPCGRRLKVDAASPPPNGKCPDCGVIVPVPTASVALARAPGHPESPTEELAATDREAIQRWADGHKARAQKAAPHAPDPEPEPGVRPTMAFSLPPSDRVEVGMRICGQCGRPLRLGAETCRECGTAAPAR